MIHGSDPTMPMPAPPCATGRARNCGSQKKSPQLANCTAEPRAMMSSVRLIRVGPKMAANGLAPLDVCRLRDQLSGSRT